MRGFDYHVSVHRFDDFESFFVYPIALEEPLPAIDIPLLPGDPPVTLDLQAVFNRCYDAGPYAREIDYGERDGGEWRRGESRLPSDRQSAHG